MKVFRFVKALRHFAFRIMNLLVAIRTKQLAFIRLCENLVPGTIRQVAKIQIEIFSHGLQMVKFQCGKIPVVTTNGATTSLQIDQVDLSLPAS